MGPLILAIDQGTTGTNVALYDQDCRLRAIVKTEFRQIFPQPGWVEHDLDDIWASVEASIRGALERAGARGDEVRAIGITNQRETTALWERQGGRPLHHAIVWQCRRTAPQCQALKEAGHEALFRERTGLVLDAYFSGTKLAWLLEHVPQARRRAERGELAFGTIDTYLVHRLTAGQAHVTDVSNASRTLLMNLETLAWDDELLRLLRVPREVLPAIRPSSEVYGTTRGLGVLPDGIPICGLAGDQQAALFGQACFDPGQVKCTYGTGAFVLMNTGRRLVRSTQGLLTTVGWKVGDEVVYALEGSVFIAGAAVQWLRDGLGVIRSSADVEALAASVPSSDGVVFVPALVGLGAPRWNPDARGTIVGLTRGTTAAHLARATLEGIAFQVRDVVVAMRQDLGAPLGFLRVDGGASQNDLLVQFQSDLLEVEIHRPRITETTSLGAALLAGLAAGVWRDREDIRRRWAIEKTFRPAMAPEVCRAHLARWEAAVAKA
ncbi:MAG TPA: glycerol kinase GlpK [Myxococcota bacterium]|nr:glycerol kinase GlpK [Myxococcota bacterium]HRY95704.1 glycerol kinase GlpK [Myxococcota bacterium]HSA21801.1 glycerol kinase GlpK [Myxococcota bacterium]